MFKSNSKLSKEQIEEIQLKITDLFPSSDDGIFRYNLNPSDFGMSQQEFLESTDQISKQKESINQDPYIYTKSDLVQMMIRSYLKSDLIKNMKQLLKYAKLEVLKVETILSIVQPARPRVTKIDIYKMIKSKGIDYDPEKGLDLDQTMELLRHSFK